MNAAQLRHIARPLLGLLLFAQGVLAMESCVALESGTAQALAQPMSDMATIGEKGLSCHEQPGDNKNACFVHCSQGEQLHSAAAAMPCLASQPGVLRVARQPELTSFRIRLAAEASQLPGGPPLSIRYCSFQI